MMLGLTEIAKWRLGGDLFALSLGIHSRVVR